MFIKKLIAYSAAATMVGMPIAAQAQQAGASAPFTHFSSNLRVASSFLCPVRGRDCVLPLPDAAPEPAPPTVTQPAPPITEAPVPVEQATERGGFPFFAILAAAAAAVGAYLLFDDDGEDLPTSP